MTFGTQRPAIYSRALVDEADALWAAEKITGRRHARDLLSVLQLVPERVVLSGTGKGVIRPGPDDACKQHLLSDFFGDRPHALVPLVLGDLPVAVRVHTFQRPPRFRQKH